MANSTVYPYGTGGSLPSSIGIINDLTTGGVDKALSAQQGVVINGMLTYNGGYEVIKQETGKQSYGTVGSPINIGDLSGCEYIKIKGVPTSVTLKTHASATLSSYIQYVDDEDNIIALDGTSVSRDRFYEYTISYPQGATAVYINGQPDTVVIQGDPTMTVKEKLDARTLIKEVAPTNYTKAEAMTAFQDTSFNGKELKASGMIGSAVIGVLGTTGDCVLRIPLAGVDEVTYPLYKSESIYGSVAVDDSDIVTWEFANTTLDNGTPKTVRVSDLNGATYLLVNILVSMTEGISIWSRSGEAADISDYVLNELPSDNYLGDSLTECLNLKGAADLYAALLQRINAPVGNGSMDAFNDFGEMPPCVYGEPGAFLADGIIDSDTARITYTDVIAKYDALMFKYPNYITKTYAGKDASNTIDMYYYTFTPKYWKQSIYLQAGVHGWEPDPIYALAEIMYLIANAYGTDVATEPYVPNNVPLRYLRGNVKITVFPVVNPWGYNNRGDCGIDKRSVAQNNANGVQLNANWESNQAEAVMVRTLVSSLASELSFAIDMHSTVWTDSRTRYGCFYGGVNQGADNIRTIYRTYEWLYQFYNVKYPSIVQGDQVPNELGYGYASVGYMTGTFNSYFYENYDIQTSTMEFSDHTWTADLHTSVALSVAVNMYLNQIIQQLNDEYKHNTETGIPAGEMFPAKG